jgi:hypothetical protein
MNTEWKCGNCKESKYLVLNISVADEVCENCGTWQNAEYNSAWVRVA